MKNPFRRQLSPVLSIDPVMEKRKKDLLYKREMERLVNQTEKQARKRREKQCGQSPLGHVYHDGVYPYPIRCAGCGHEV